MRIAYILTIIVFFSGCADEVALRETTNQEQDHMTFATKQLPEKPDYLAPDGSEVRLLLGLSRGDMAHFTLPPKRTSKAVRHKNVEEVWYVLSGSAQMWRKDGEREEVVDAVPGTSLSIPPNVRFQFRTIGDEPFKAVAITMPPWPGEDEAVPVDGKW